MAQRILFRRGYKYQLAAPYQVRTLVTPDREIRHPYYRLTADGVLTIRWMYAWDGPSGPTVDTKSFMRGSLVHDCLYQAIKDGLLDPSWREQADQELRRICLEDGMTPFRAWYVYRSVRLFGGKAIASGARIVEAAP